jgi:hypothetical protein
VNPFDAELWVTPSLNAAVIAAIPGVELPGHIRGKRGGDLLFVSRLEAVVRENAGALGLDPDSAEILLDFNTSFDNPETRDNAIAIAREHGSRLGYLLLMLVRGDAINRAARPAYSPWRDEHWAHWQAMQQVWIGGGQVAGRLGVYSIAQAQTVLTTNGATLAVHLAQFPQNLALIGLARATVPRSRYRLVVDFGQTHVKCALACYENGQLARLDLLPGFSAECRSLFDNISPDTAQHHFDAIVARIANTLFTLQARYGHIADIALSLACYLRNGHPREPANSCYGSLQLVAEHLESALKAAIEGAVGSEIDFALLHDGTAAANAFQGGRHAAVITLGTAIGIGFVPPVVTVDAAPHFRLQFAS